jgi:hypothetical protein
VWNVDNHFCKGLNSLRSSTSPLPAPLKPFTQLHAWWHLFSGLGSYLLLIAGNTIRLTYADVYKIVYLKVPPLGFARVRPPTFLRPGRSLAAPHIIVIMIKHT